MLSVFSGYKHQLTTPKFKHSLTQKANGHPSTFEQHCLLGVKLLKNKFEIRLSRDPYLAKLSRQAYSSQQQDVHKQ